MDNNERTMFINVVDEATRRDILRLDQKLRGLMIEIEAKIESLAFEKDKSQIEVRKEQLLNLKSEVKAAIDNIKELVNIVVGEGGTPLDPESINSDDLTDFRNTIQESLDKITQLKDSF